MQQRPDRVMRSIPGYYGWVIVMMSAAAVFLSGPGQTYSVSIFIDAYIEEFGWSRSLVSALYAGATLLSGTLMIWFGSLIDRFGQRKASISAAVLLGLACLFNSLLLGPVMLFFGFFFIRLFGQGLMEMVPNTLVPRWFSAKRGKAFALMEVGGFLSAAVLPPLNVWLIAGAGWQGAWQIWGAILLVCYLPLVILFVRNAPGDYGLQVDGLSWKESERAGNAIADAGLTLQQALRSPSFWAVIFCIAVPAMVNTGLTFHMVSILGEQGLTRGEASFVLSLVALTAFPLSFLAGAVLDRFPLPTVFALTFLTEASAVLVLLAGEGYTSAVLFGLLRGTAAGFGTICLALIIPNFFGTAHLGSLKGVGVTATVTASAIGPLPFGLAFDQFGSYNEILLLMLVFPLTASFVAWKNKGPVIKRDR
ncbi:MFS transporter [Alkalicoccus luteus]|uniref:MFS transporter n=1 Tax=Alkalicoccus luteus TaxID=1237094 RepID=A0A969TVE8_9BACI|nr:MFS transporter [Alkalicoccus luteus]NJP38032.1 MFS transporter [Alkalicoccus luteus]